jgi:putative NADH-flavin reductase
MDTALLGATGAVGTALREELLGRRHTVRAVMRHPERLNPDRPGLTLYPGDVFDEAFLSRAAWGEDVLVCAVALRDRGQRNRTPVQLTRALMRVSESQKVRLVMIGGAGSLRDEQGRDLVDTPDFPAFAKAESAGFRDALRSLRSEAPKQCDWTFVSPPLDIEFGGARTGIYRSAADSAVVDGSGCCSISAADLAVAVVDEIERPAHQRRRFTVGY